MFEHFRNHLTYFFVFSPFVMATFASPARADLLIPIVLSPGNSVNPLPNFTDPNLATNFPVAESFFGTGSSPTGALIAFVNTSPLNPFGKQGLVFTYEISVETGNVVQISLDGFGDFATAVQQSTAGATSSVPALDANRSSDGNTLTFDFAGIPGGFTTSSDLNVYTNALGYADNSLVTITDISGSTAQSLSVGPTAPLLTATPEPTSFVLILTAILAACAVNLSRKFIGYQSLFDSK